MSAIDTACRTVFPVDRLGGVVTVPGDKSISHRIAMLGTLAGGETTVRGFLRSADCVTLLKVMQELGAAWRFEGELLRLRGVGGRLRAPSGPLDVGNSGTSMRLLPGLLAGQAFACELTGDASLRSRPMRRIQEPLERMGARVELCGERGCAPLRISGGCLHGIEYAPPVASAQVKSCVLFAGLFAEGTTAVIEPKATRDHTERMLNAMGVPVHTDASRVWLEGYGGRGPQLSGRDWVVPGDFSSAAFWITAAAVTPGCRLEVRGVGLNPRRTALLDVLQRMGAAVEVEPACQAGACEALGTIRVEGRGLTGTEVGGGEIPDLIDELPLVAVAAAKAQGQTVVRDAAELRVKESDRVRSVVDNLVRLGVQAAERPDGFVIDGGAPIRGDVVVTSYGDHRIPMAMSILALSASAPVRLEGVTCVNKSYPEFWDDLKKVGGHVE